MNNNNIYKITNSQKTIWNTEKYYESKPITNIAGTAIMNIKVDFKILEKAINSTVEKNNALRIKIKVENNIPMQYFDEFKYFNVDLYEVKDSNKLEKLMREISKKPLRYNKGTLIKFIMFKFPDETGGVGIIINHLLSDAWSTTLIASEVVGNYDKILNNCSLEDSINSSYLEYIQDEEEYKNSDKILKDKAFWEKQFNDFPEEIASIKTKDVLDINDTKAYRKEIVIDEIFTAKVKEYCKTNKISPYTFFLSIYTMYIYIITNQNDIVVSTPILNRRNVEEKNTMGMFVNSLPLRIKIEENCSVNEIFHLIAEKSLKIFKHQRYSIFEILEYVRKKISNNNIYDFVFSYQNASSRPTINKIPYSLKWYFNGNITETINIHVSDLDSVGKFVIYYDYKISQLSEEDILNLHDRIITIIDQIIDKDEIKLNSINILSKKDIQALQTINNTGNIEIENESISDIFENMSKTFKKNIAIKYKNIEINYEELYKRVVSLANVLRKNGVTRNTPVALLLDKSPEMIIAMFAIIKAGGCYVPILPDEDQKRIDYIISDCKPNCVITNTKYSEKIINNKIINIEKELLEYKDFKNVNQKDDLLYIIYTSGSTGNPKGTQIMHKNVDGLMKSMYADNNIKPTENDVSMSLLKYSFDASGIDIYSALLFGGKLLLIDKENELNPQIVVKTMEEEKVTRSFLIPKWVEQIAQEDEKQNTNLSSLKILGTGGETLKPETVKNLYEKYEHLKIINLYGPTETTMFTTYQVLSHKEFESNDTTIGQPIKYSRILVLDKKDRVLPINTRGELAIYEDGSSIENIAKGYLNLPDETEKRFKKIYSPILQKEINVYKTGDFVRINENLEIVYLGRTDDIVKINGSYLVALNEVEDTIYKILNEKYNICIVAVPYNNTKVLVCFVEDTIQNEIDGIRKFINKHITFYMKPKKIIAIKKFPVNNSGKTNRKALKELAINSINSNEKEIVTPKNQTEQIVYNIIKKYVNTDNISIKDDFMNDLGIDSLMIASIYSELEFYKIKLQDLYTYSTIETLSNYISVGDSAKIEYEAKDIPIIDDCKKFDLSNVLLTGVTGFLGIHILKELLNNKTTSKIYCLIRDKEFKSGSDRLKERVEFYFGKTLNKLIEKKVVVINGNITKENIGLDVLDYNDLQKNVTTVINSAANVRHYCKMEDLIKDNVESVNNILCFCKNNISLAHISTLSIAGFKDINTEKTTYNENSLYIKQSFNNNPYLISKFMAEQILLENKTTNIKIFRLGNIMPRHSDGKFQINYNQNAFLNAIRNIVNTRKIPQEVLDLKVEFSPVDDCATSIIRILQYDINNKIYHILNNNFISIRELVEIFKKLNYNVEIVNIKEFVDTIENQDEVGKQYIKEYILQNSLNNYSMEKTVNTLKRFHFKWSLLDKKYIKMIINLINEKRW